MPPISSATLPQTLAQRVQVLREKLGITPARLAEQAQVSQSLIEDIEGGLELFLSPAIRQKLARALRVRPATLQAVEKPVEVPPAPLSPQGLAQFLEEIQLFPTAHHTCPACGGTLVVRVFSRRDLEDNPLEELKVHCGACLFKI